MGMKWSPISPFIHGSLGQCSAYVSTLPMQSALEVHGRSLIGTSRAEGHRRCRSIRRGLAVDQQSCSSPPWGRLPVMSPVISSNVRIVLDTSVLISALRSERGAASEVVRLAMLGELTVLMDHKRCGIPGPTAISIGKVPEADCGHFEFAGSTSQGRADLLHAATAVA